LDQTTTLMSLREQVRIFCEDRDWDQFHGPKDLAIGVITEASELLERFRFLDEDASQKALTDDRQRSRIGDELADVLFFLLRFADRFDFDLDDALRRKMAMNAKNYPVNKARGSNRKYSEL